MESGSSVALALAMGEKRKGREEEETVVGFNHLPVHRFYYTSGGGSGDFYEEAKVWQPYNSSTPYKASVVPMRVFPFTSAQWQELQRQALIYKHIMASVPVPPDLLLPISARAFPEAPPLFIQPTMVGGENGVARFNLRFSTNSTDPEPGRCRRTDGKKWRCSRDAAPDQKYCERHMHRGRPRSRKPVELRNNKNNNSNSNSKSAASATDVDTAMTATASVTVNPSNTSQATGLLTKVDLKLPFQSMEPTNDTRYLDNFASNQQWMQPHYEDLPNLNYTNLNDQSCPFLNPDLSVLEQDAAGDNEAPRSFIDAWSTEYASATATTNPAEAMPSLTLSMSNNADAIEGEIQMGLGLTVKSMKWTGGPLAEALQSTSNMTSTSGSSKSTCVDLINLMCKSCCGSQEVSPRDSPRRVASSPSRVLHKPPVSMSDSSSSSNNSFQWMNHQPK